MLPSLGSREGTSRPKSNCFPCLGQLPWYMWRKDVGQKADSSKRKFMPLHGKKAVLEDPQGSLNTWRDTVYSQSQAGQRQEDLGLQSVRGQPEASVMFGYLSTFLSSCSVKKHAHFLVLWKPGAFPVTWSIVWRQSHSLCFSNGRLTDELFILQQSGQMPLSLWSEQTSPGKVRSFTFPSSCTLLISCTSVFMSVSPSDHELLKGYVLFTFIFFHTQAYC